MPSSKIRHLSYNTLWALAYTYASSVKMPPHRAAQFATAYARTFEGEPGFTEPYEFVALAAACDFHYHS